MTCGKLIGHLSAERTVLTFGEPVVDLTVTLGCIIEFAALQLLVGILELDTFAPAGKHRQRHSRYNIIKESELHNIKILLI